MTEYYLTRVELNPQRRGARKLIGSAQAMHAAVEAGFPPSSRRSGDRNLWRLDAQGIEHRLYVLSPSRPDFSHLIEQAGWSTSSEPWLTKPYNPLLERVENGSAWEFRLAANPIHQTLGKDGKSKKFAHVTVSQQLGWLLDKAEKSGFSLLHERTGEPAVTVVGREHLKFRRRKEGQEAQVSIRRVTFEGALRVTDAELFRKALVQGVGRAKAYGCGLMTVVPLAQTRQS